LRERCKRMGRGESKFGDDLNGYGELGGGRHCTSWHIGWVYYMGKASWGGAGKEVHIMQDHVILRT
jgi:hypothetical protein